jgi:hypothetical protein
MHFVTTSIASVSTVSQKSLKWSELHEISGDSGRLKNAGLGAFFIHGVEEVAGSNLVAPTRISLRSKIAWPWKAAASHDGHDHGCQTPAEVRARRYLFL